MMNMKKAQSSIEMFLLFGALLTFGLGVFIVNINSQAIVRYKEAELNAQRVLSVIENEVSIALKIGDGYERTFNLASPSGDADYIISQENGLIDIRWDGGAVNGRLPTKQITDGTDNSFEISFGDNKISNDNGEIIIEAIE